MIICHVSVESAGGHHKARSCHVSVESAGGHHKARSYVMFQLSRQVDIIKLDHMSCFS